MYNQNKKEYKQENAKVYNINDVIRRLTDPTEIVYFSEKYRITYKKQSKWY